MDGRRPELPAATYAGTIERLEMVSVLLIAHPRIGVIDGVTVGMAYGDITPRFTPDPQMFSPVVVQIILILGRRVLC